jgi:hypothetical protein
MNASPDECYLCRFFGENPPAQYVAVAASQGGLVEIEASSWFDYD